MYSHFGRQISIHIKFFMDSRFNTSGVKISYFCLKLTQFCQDAKTFETFFSIFSVRELATFPFKHLNNLTFKFNFQAQQLFNERNKITLSGTNKGIDSVSCVVTFQLDSCLGHIILQVSYSLVSGCRRGKEELTVTVKSMAKLLIDQNVTEMDL